MDDDLRRLLFDPGTTRDLVLARRPLPRSAVACVVSDVVWTEVVRLLRWAAAGTHGAPSLQAGTWWRLAAGCADLLRRLPGLSAELGEGWTRQPGPDADSDRTGTERVQRAAARLTGLLNSTGPVPLHRLATGVDQLGAAAISALAEPSWSTLPRTP